MNILLIGLGFIVITMVVGILVAKFVVRALPAQLRQASALHVIVGYSLAAIGLLFLTQWGYDPVIISIGPNELFLDPRRWVWWVLAAIFVGAAEGFLFHVRAFGAKTSVAKTSARKHVDTPDISTP